MTTKEFKKKWLSQGDSLTPIDLEVLSGLHLKETSIDFLVNAGLPISAAPFLTFTTKSLQQFNPISTLNDIYGFLGKEFRQYVVIGFDGSGNPITINTSKNDVIQLLDHDNYFSPHYFNNSIEILFEFLLIYRDFIRGKGDDFTDEEFDILKDRMEAIDPSVFKESGFWKEMLEIDIANRDDFRANP